MIGRLPDVAGADVVEPASDVSRRRCRRAGLGDLRRTAWDRGSVVTAAAPSLSRLARLAGAGDAGDLGGDAGGDRVDDLLLGRLLALEHARSLRPRRSTVIRSATSKTSCRLCEMITTARPCSARRLTSSSTCRVWATPSAAVGSSRITSREFHITARATATDWRWPPERLATFWRIERIVVTDEALHRLGRLRLHLGLLQPADDVVRLAAEVHVLDDVEVVAEREILVDDLDPERAPRPSGRGS